MFAPGELGKGMPGKVNVEVKEGRGREMWPLHAVR